MENGITKRQSMVLQGVAILMMVYHHLYSFAVEYESLLPFMHIDMVRKTAWFCKLCVGIFAFISGYGMYYVMSKQTGKSFGGRLLSEYQCVLQRILKLYGKLWLVLFIYLGIYVGILKLPFAAEQLPGNFTALNPTYNGAWWYVEQYAKMLLVLPFMDLLFTRFEADSERKYKWVFFGALTCMALTAALAGLLWWPALWELLLAVKSGLRLSFLLIFVVGYLSARFAIYQRVEKGLRHLGKWVPVCLAVALIGIVIGLRVRLTEDAAYAKMDFLFTPLLIYGLLTLLAYVPPLSGVLAWWGRQSTYIWLVHGFLYPWIYLFIRPYVRLDTCIYLAVLLASAAVALLLNMLGKLPTKLKRDTL